MALQCGIVGLPNVGKSTIFNALTAAGAQMANYPFCTIEPNVGVVTVADDRLGQLSDIANPQKVLPTVMEFVDIAGLVSGASKGEGLGNQFWAISVRLMRLPMWCAVLRMMILPMLKTGLIRLPIF